MERTEGGITRDPTSLGTPSGSIGKVEVTANCQRYELDSRNLIDRRKCLGRTFELIRSLRVAIAAAVVMAAMTPLNGVASGMTLHVSRPDLHARIEISITFAINCPTPAAGDSVTQEVWGASVEQAVGTTQIATGQFQDFVQSPSPMPWQCTSSNVTLPVVLLANVPGPPFHTGAAILTASVSVTYASGATVSASVGPKVVKLQR
jgi:hypothetical protein